MKNKKGFTPQIFTLIIVAALVYFGYALAKGSIHMPKLAATEPTKTTEAGKICRVEDVTATFSSLEKYSGANVGSTHKYRVISTVNGERIKGAWQSVNDLGTKTLSYGQEVDVVFNDGNTTVYRVLKHYTVPCQGTVEFAYADSCKNMTSVTIRVFNEEGNLIDSSGENETLDAGDVVTLSGDITGTYEACNPYGYVVCATFSSTKYDDVVLSFQGVGSKKTTVPDFVTPQAGKKTKCYEAPAVYSNEKVAMSVLIDVDDSNNPGSTDDITLNFYDKNYYFDTDSKEYKLGVQDADGNAVGMQSLSFTIQVD